MAMISLLARGLGTKWWEPIFFVGCRRLFFGASIQYSIRSEGDFDYQFAKHLTWNGGPRIISC